jgi:hypothetical protein
MDSLSGLAQRNINNKGQTVINPSIIKKNMNAIRISFPITYTFMYQAINTKI